MTAHWEQRDHWLNGENERDSFSEIWDGKKFSELKWFWDREEYWLLPVRCPWCAEVISAAHISTSMTEAASSNACTIRCPYCCYTAFPHQVKYATGDPRNIALVGHWDGWKPFSTSAKHSCGTYVYVHNIMLWIIFIGSFNWDTNCYNDKGRQS